MGTELRNQHLQRRQSNPAPNAGLAAVKDAASAGPMFRAYLNPRFLSSTLLPLLLSGSLIKTEE